MSLHDVHQFGSSKVLLYNNLILVIHFHSGILCSLYNPISMSDKTNGASLNPPHRRCKKGKLCGTLSHKCTQVRSVAVFSAWAACKPTRFIYLIVSINASPHLDPVEYDDQGKNRTHTHTHRRLRVYLHIVHKYTPLAVLHP